MDGFPPVSGGSRSNLTRVLLLHTLPHDEITTNKKGNIGQTSKSPVLLPRAFLLLRG